MLTEPRGGGEFADGYIVRVKRIDSVATAGGRGGGVGGAPFTEREHGGFIGVIEEGPAFAAVAGGGSDGCLGVAFFRPNDGLFGILKRDKLAAVRARHEVMAAVGVEVAAPKYIFLDVGGRGVNHKVAGE